MPDYLTTKEDVFKGEKLPVGFSIFVPETLYDKKIPDAQFKKRIKEVEMETAKMFGGFTKSDSVGGWVDGGKLIQERIARVTVYSTPENWKKNKHKLVAYIKKKKQKWRQELISVEYESDLILV